MATVATTPMAMGIHARNAAIKQLIANHQDEFDKLHEQEREARGLAANPDEQRRIAKIERLKTQLRDLGVDIP
jgi:hypothetical protein